MRTRLATMDAHQQVGRVLYIVAGLYVTAGLLLAAASAILGDRLGILLGFIIVSGAVAMTALLRAVLHIEFCLGAIASAVDDLRERFNHVEGIVRSLNEQLMPTVSSSNGGVRILDLASVGAGDPTVLTAATLDRRHYPRLVTTLDGEPSAQGDQPPDSEMMPSSGGLDAAGTPPRHAAQTEASDQTAEVKDHDVQLPGTDNLVAQWEIAVGHGDLAGCRALYAALVQASGREAAAPLRARMEALADRVEHSLRDAFTDHVRRGDFAAAIAIGERMCHLLPGRPVCAEFERLRPHLMRRLSPPRTASGQR